ncbi:conserved hypothetical protein, membrane [Candidatus Magnetomorum sp. HK-1]|nr:conserved hypothetical protein, membrane [Candidatus Magnetomorum sp. HK-1]
MLTQLKNIFTSKMGIALSCTFGGISLYWIAQNFRSVGVDRIINTLLLFIMVAVLVLILYNLIKIVKEKKSSPVKKRDNESIKNSLNEELEKTLKHFEPDNLANKTWILIAGKTQWTFGNLSNLLDTDSPITAEPVTVDCENVKFDLIVFNKYVFVDISKYHSNIKKNNWQIFFNLLAKYRDTLPINIIIVSIPVTSILQVSDKKILTSQANELRQQLINILSVLKSSPPIYTVLTELESVLGFSEFVEILFKKTFDKTVDAGQIFGWNNPVPAFDETELKEAFADISQTLYQWGQHGQLKIPDTETGLKLFAFQEEIRSMTDNAVTFFKIFFRFDDYLWRGFYFLGLKEDNPYFFDGFFKKIYRERHLVRPSYETLAEEDKTRTWFLISTCIVIIIAYFMVNNYKSINSEMKQETKKFEKQVNNAIQHPPKQLEIHYNSTIEAMHKCKDVADNRLWIDYYVKKNLTFIKDFYLNRVLFQPFLLQTTEALENLKMPQNRDILVNALKQGILLMSGKSYAEINLDQLSVLLPPYNNNTLKVKLLDQHQNDRYLAESDYRKLAFNIRTGIGKLYNYWCDDRQQISDQGNNDGDLINSFYQESLKKLENKRYPIHSIIREIQLLMKHLSAIKDKQIAIALKPECEKEYAQLLDTINDSRQDSPRLLSNLKTTIKRHQMVCENLDRKGDKENDSYAHIWVTNGAVTDEIQMTIKALQLAENFCLKFTNVSVDDINGDLIEDLRKEKISTTKEFEDIFKTITSPQWEAERLNQLLTFWLDQLYENIYNKFIENIRKNALSDNDYPSIPVARVSKKIPTITPSHYSHQRNDDETSLTPDGLLNKQKQFIKTLQDYNETLNEDDRKRMVDQYEQLVIHWWKQINTLDSADQIKDIQSWKEFREYVCQIKGKFIDINQSPLEQFLKHVTQEKFQQLKELQNDHLFDDSIKTKEAEILNVADKFNNPLFLNHLEKAQKEFYERVNAMMPEKNLSNIDQLEIFSSFIENCGIPETQLHQAITELATIETRAFDIFNKDRSVFVKKQFDKFVNNWRYVFDQYPFIEEIDTDVKRDFTQAYPHEILTVSTVSLKEMYNFFFDENIGLNSLLSQNGTDFEQILSDKDNYFLQTCWKWQQFLFDSTSKPKQHHIRFVWDISMQTSANLFTRIKIPELFGEQTFQLENKNTPFSANWENDFVNIITVNAYQESKKQFLTTEEGWFSTTTQENLELVVKQSKLTIKGDDLFLVAYTKKFSDNCQNLYDGKTRCHVWMSLPDFDKNLKKKDVAWFEIEWDAIIPENITWLNKNVR